MTLNLVASSSVEPGDQPVDPRQLIDDRKILRLLSPLAVAPLSAALTAYDAASPASPARTAVYTVGGWEERGDGPAEGSRRSSTPVGELQRMTTLPLCVIMLARGIMGPNAHWVGDGATTGHLLGLVEQLLVDRAADRALVVAFDRATESTSAGTTTSTAAAVLVTLGRGNDPDGLRPALAASSLDGLSATAALRGLGSKAQA